MVENQTYLFLIFSLTGIVIGVLFDIFRVLRKSFKTPNIITYIQDILFWIITGFLILYNIWYFNDGEIRIYMFLGIIIGVLIYALTLSKIFCSILYFIIKKLEKIISIPLIPIIKICRKTYKNIKIIVNKMENNRRNLMNFKNKRGNLEENGE